LVAIYLPISTGSLPLGRSYQPSLRLGEWCKLLAIPMAIFKEESFDMARHRIIPLFFGMALVASASIMLAISKHILTPIHMLVAGTVLITLYIIPYLPPLKADSTSERS